MSYFWRALPVSLFLVGGLLLPAPSARASYGADDAHRQHLYETFISPCCWRENLAVHDSGIAAELRGRIDRMVEAGSSDEEIKSALVGEYGKRILALPEGAERAWLFWMPAVTSFAGLGFLMFMLHRLRKQRPAMAGAAHDIEPASLPPGWDEF